MNVRKLCLLLVFVMISFVGFASTNSNKILGQWEWSNAPFDYPTYIEFRSNGDMFIYKMKPSGKDTEKYKWTLDRRTIYYCRPAADKKVVYTIRIKKNDGKTMILHDSEGDLWLTKVVSSK